MSIIEKLLAAAGRGSAGAPHYMPPSSQQPYTMAQVDEDEAEITLYGDIVSQRPVDWWTGEPVDGQFIMLSEFLEDIKAVEKVSRLTVRIHSVGGHAYDSMAIHNRLKELKAHVTVIVDGVAMSGGSLIMCAGDTVRINAGSLVMIHECWGFMFGGYSASELRKIAESNAAVDRVQAAIYNAKTGIPEAELLGLMAAETYMTGKEALEKGFADELNEAAPAPDFAASADRQTLFMGGLPVWAAPGGKALPESLRLPTVSTAAMAAAEIKTPMPGTSGKKGGEIVKTIDELRAAFPDLTAQLEADAKAAVVPADNTEAIKAAVNAERERIRAIDEIAPSILDETLVREAKYGDKSISAQELAFQALKKGNQQGAEFIANAQADAAASGAAGVPAATPPPSEVTLSSREALEAQAKADAEEYKKMKGDAK